MWIEAGGNISQTQLKRYFAKQLTGLYSFKNATLGKKKKQRQAAELLQIKEDKRDFNNECNA